MQEKNKRLFENILSQGALQIVSYIIPLITYPYQVRVVGVEKFGLVSFAMALTVYFSLIVDFGFNLYATKAISQNRHNNNNISNIFNSVMFVKTGLTLFCFLILTCMIMFIPEFRNNCLVFVFSFLFVIGQNLIYPTWFFIGQERMKYINCITMFARLIFLLLLIIFVRQQSDYLLIPLLNGVGVIITGLIALIYAIKYFKLKLYIPRMSYIIKTFKEGGQFFLANAAASILSNTNAFVLGLTGSKIFVGFYAAAEKIYFAILSLKLPIELPLYPYMAKNKDVKFFKKIMTITTIVNTVVCIGIIIFSKIIMTLIFGAEMLSAYRLLQLFCIAAIFEFPSLICGYQQLIIFGHKTEANLSVYITSAFHLIMLGILFLTGHLNMYNVAALVACSSLLNLAVRMYFVNKFKILKQENGL